jgi:hypothetical protein
MQGDSYGRGNRVPCYAALIATLLSWLARADDISISAGLVRVAVVVDTQYDDSAKSVAAIRDFVEFFPPESDEVGPSEDVLHFVIRRYGFGSKSLPKSYSILKANICSINHLTRDDIPIATSRLFAPPLPRRRVPKPFPGNPYYAFPRIATFTRSSAVSATGTITTLLQQGQTDSAFRRGARVTIVSATMSRSELLSRKDTSLFSSKHLRVMGDNVELYMTPASCGSTSVTSTFLDKQLRADIATVLATPTKQPAYLFVVDTGWPTEADYKNAISVIEPLLNTLRSESGLTPYVRSSPYQYQPLVTNTHAARVAAALNELQSLDSQRRVKIIFMPLALDQGDIDFFKNLFETWAAYSWTHSLDALTPAGRQLDTAVLQESASEYAKGVLDDMRKFGKGTTMYTNGAVLDATYMVADALAAKARGHYFLNESWSLLGSLVRISNTRRVRGMTIAAPRDIRQDFIAKEDEFALECLTSDNYLAVMNISSAGAEQCYTSVVDPARVPDLRLVGFDGNIEGSSGTSFAAPRVAWLMALRETARPPDNTSYWATDTIRAVRASRAASGPDWKTIWFDFHSYIQK